MSFGLFFIKINNNSQQIYSLFIKEKKNLGYIISQNNIIIKIKSLLISLFFSHFVRFSLLPTIINYLPLSLNFIDHCLSSFFVANLYPLSPFNIDHYLLSLSTIDHYLSPFSIINSRTPSSSIINHCSSTLLIVDYYLPLLSLLTTIIITFYHLPPSTTLNFIYFLLAIVHCYL